MTQRVEYRSGHAPETLLHDMPERPELSAARAWAARSLARIHHRAQRYREEADAWQKVLDAEASRQAAAAEILTALDRLNAEATVRLESGRIAAPGWKRCGQQPPTTA